MEIPAAAVEEMVTASSPFWKGRSVFVTGAAGFIGSWLTKDLLARGARVTALIDDLPRRSELARSGDVRRIRVARGRLENLALLRRIIRSNSIDTVFHLGAQTIVSDAYRAPFDTFESNVRGTYNLMEACRQAPSVGRIIVASSDKAYGDQKILPYREDTALQGRFPYDVSKSCTDLIAQSYYHAYRLPVAILRCGNVFGGGDLNDSRIVPGTIRALLRGEAPVIRSDGKYVRDYIYVKDVSAAYLTVAERLVAGKLQGEAFNFGNDKPWSVLAMVALLRKALKREDLRPEILNVAKAEIREQYLASGKARKMLKWRPRYSMSTAVAETVAWYRDAES